MLTMTGKGHSEHKFPFSIELVRFTLKRYPGSDSPSSFESLVRIHDGATNHEQLIAMNRVLDWRGYRFFQSSFDTDEQGSVLSVNQDPAGRYITYTGYALLLAGFIACFITRNGRVRYLINRLN
jgi:cytochrome c biogenesis protein ResB